MVDDGRGSGDLLDALRQAPASGVTLTGANGMDRLYGGDGDDLHHFGSRAYVSAMTDAERAAALRARFGVPVWLAVGVEGRADLPDRAPGVDALMLDAKPPRDATLPGGNAHAFVTATVALRKFWSTEAFTHDVDRRAGLVTDRLTALADEIPGARVKGRGLMQGVQVEPALAARTTRACARWPCSTRSSTTPTARAVTSWKVWTAPSTGSTTASACTRRTTGCSGSTPTSSPARRRCAARAAW